MFKSDKETDMMRRGDAVVLIILILLLIVISFCIGIEVSYAESLKGKIDNFFKLEIDEPQTIDSKERIFFGARWAAKIEIIGICLILFKTKGNIYIIINLIIGMLLI